MKPTPNHRLRDDVRELRRVLSSLVTAVGRLPAWRLLGTDVGVPYHEARQLLARAKPERRETAR